MGSRRPQQKGGLVHGVGPCRSRPVLVLLIPANPTPPIDVVYVVQQAAEAMAGGRNPYGVVFVYPDWMAAAGDALTTDPYPYLPMSAVLLAIPATLLLAARFGPGAGRRSHRPGASTVTRMGGLPSRGPPRCGTSRHPSLMVSSWIEPLLLVLLVTAYAQFARARNRSAVAWLGVALATKHTALLAVPALLRWPAAGSRRVLQACVVAGLIVLPFVLMNPARFAAGPMSVLGLASDERADSVSLPGLLVALGAPSPWWLTPLGLVAAVLVVRRSTNVSQALISAAAFMTVFYWFSAHTFYNFYWLAAGLLAAALGTLAPQAGARGAPPATSGAIESRRGDSNP